MRAEAASGSAQAGRLLPEAKVGKDAKEAKPLLRKLPPVPTFAAPKPARADPGLIAAETANGADRGASGQKSSEAISLLLDEYDDADE